MAEDGLAYDRPQDAKNPGHYRGNGVELIAITEQMPFNRGNAVKYLVRAGKKGGPEKEIEDLEKALWYVQRELERTKKLRDHEG